MRKVFGLRYGVALMAALAISGLGASVSAASPNNPKADIQQGNGFCGADVSSLPVIGFVNYHRSGDTVSIEYHLKGAVAGADYTVQLWGASCSYFGTIGTVTTNQNGVANLNGSVAVPSAVTRFFATAAGPNVWNDTPAVTLLP